jgi:hypothetical protein
MTDAKAREIATALRLARFRGDMPDEDFAKLVKEVVRVLYPIMGKLPVKPMFGNFPPPKLAAAI